jgi:hypothetical protein
MKIGKGCLKSTRGCTYNKVQRQSGRFQEARILDGPTCFTIEVFDGHLPAPWVSVFKNFKVFVNSSALIMWWSSISSETQPATITLVFLAGIPEKGSLLTPAFPPVPDSGSQDTGHIITYTDQNSQ